MLNILDAYSDVLPPTRTYRRRSFTFIPACDEYRQRTGLLGQLLIKLQHSKSGTRRAVECDGYSVERDTPEPGDNGGQSFWVHNVTDPDSEEAYRCVIGGLTPSRCTCTAGKCRVPSEQGITDGCKHRDGIQALLAAGLV